MKRKKSTKSADQRLDLSFGRFVTGEASSGEIMEMSDHREKEEPTTTKKSTSLSSLVFSHFHGVQGSRLQEPTVQDVGQRDLTQI